MVYPLTGRVADTQLAQSRPNEPDASCAVVEGLALILNWEGRLRRLFRTSRHALRTWFHPSDSQNQEARRAFLDAWKAKHLNKALGMLSDEVAIALAPTKPMSVELSADGKRQIIRYLSAIGATPVPEAGKNGKIVSLSFSIPPEQTAGLYIAMLNPWSVAESPKSGKRSGVINGLGQVLGLAGGVLSGLYVFYLLFPGARPEEPPEILGATLQNVAIEERRTTSLPPGYCKYDEESGGGANLGVISIISFDITFVGYKGDRAIVKWAKFDPETRARTDITLNDGPHIRPEAPDDRATGQVCMPAPGRAQCVFVRVYLYEEDQETRLDYIDTQPFFTGLNDDGQCVGDSPASPPA